MENWVLGYGNHQHKGRRKDQQDYFASSDPTTPMEVVESENGFLAIVADGMGGHIGGGSASVIAVETFMKEYNKKEKAESIPDALSRALLKANDAVFRANEQAGEESDMGTTLVACVLQSNKLYWVSVGDSKLFLYRDRQLQQLNQEHSYGVQLDMQRKAGQISETFAQAEARRRNQLTSYLGAKKIPPEIDRPAIPHELKTHDKVLLCSDGLVDALNKEEIINDLETERSTQEKCESLTTSALNKNRPHQDNITTILLELNPKPPKIESKPSKKTRQYTKKKIGFVVAAAILTALVLAAILSFILKDGKTDQPPEPTPIPTIAATSTPEPPPTPTIKQEELISCTYENIQIVLKEEKLYVGAIDNVHGGGTKDALEVFQRQQDLQVTGISDDKTCKAMEPFFQKYKHEILITYQQLACFTKEEYEELLRKFPTVGDIPKSFVIDRENMTCIYLNKLSKDQKDKLGEEAFNEILKHTQ